MQIDGTFGDFQPRHKANANVPDIVVISATSLMSQYSETEPESAATVSLLDWKVSSKFLCISLLLFLYEKLKLT
ncbi:hypothetical protein DPMN_129632 [Dreissena polymorpha]|uniref:Uncharacterized protein n=1 Tax=Dreissena polymorpha TaxID=45954 RepID=A0A9D4JXK0_DREPO|nr:hypothetical protein DPMN_129632 [Dreissena polymorpha]